MVKAIAVTVAAAFVGVAGISWAQTSTSSSTPSSTMSPSSTTSPSSGATTQPGSTLPSTTLPSTTLPGTGPNSSTTIGGSTSSSVGAGASAPLPSQCVGLVGLERERCIQRNGSATGAAGGTSSTPTPITGPGTK